MADEVRRGTASVGLDQRYEAVSSALWLCPVPASVTLRVLLSVSLELR